MTASFTCPVCDMTSHHPQDVENEYCGNCHRFASDVLTGAEQSTEVLSAAHALGLALQELDLPVILAGEREPAGARVMLMEGDGISLRRGGTFFYGENGEPIPDEPVSAMLQIEAIRNAPGGELSAVLDFHGVQVWVSTAYLGVDLSIFGPLPLVWETLGLVGELPPHILGPWRYATRAAAHAGHEKVVAAIRQAAGDG